MVLLPKWFTGVLEGFAPLFSARVWPQVQLLVVGALLSPGKRTVTAALRVLGLADDPRFGTFHRLLNRARWSSLQASRVLLTLLMAAFVPSGPLVLGLDDTIERRTGAKIKAGTALLFASHEISVVRKIAATSGSPLLQKLNAGMNSLTGEMTTLGTALKGGQLPTGGIEKLNADTEAFKAQAAAAGQPIKDVRAAIGNF
ncbi:transposase (plasmid) [Deinococcus radiomollis]|uniref:transposase n=1 Tax=Deinococcus radiomollis TaxID=468916 RepID=UPI003891B34B